MSESTLSPSQGFRIWLLLISGYQYGAPLCLRTPSHGYEPQVKQGTDLTLWYCRIGPEFPVTVLHWRWKLMVSNRLWYRTGCVVRSCINSRVRVRIAARQSFYYKCGAAGWGELYLLMFDWSTLMIPQKAMPCTAFGTLLWFVSYRHLSPHIQSSVSAVTL